MDRVGELLALGTATLGESGGFPMHPRIKPAWRGARLAGPTVTVRCVPGDNLAIHAAVAESAASSVVVVSVGERREVGYWGEVLTVAAQQRAIAGLVIDGGVRDVSALEARGFPAFATVVALPGARKVAGGEVGTTVEVGAVGVRPGDWVVGAVDGVVVIREDDIDAVMSAARARAERERDLFHRLERGATTLELLGLDPSPVRRPTS
jgi:4-hydroxy-4-methyl-2-oxoglutarate aldolase